MKKIAFFDIDGTLTLSLIHIYAADDFAVV